MGILELILAIAIIGFLVWIILQIPMPQVFRNVIIGVVVVLLIVWVMQSVGLIGSINPRIR